MVEDNILLVCTANRCRSPLAEFWVADRIAAGSLPWSVASAGVQARPGDVIESDVITVLDEVGVAADQRASQRLDARAVHAATLVLTAERDHRSAVLRLAPALVGRVFTMLEFERLVRAAWGAPGWRRPESLPALAALADGARSRAGTSGPGDDLADPLGGGPPAFRRCRDEITRALTPLLTSFAR